MIAVKMDDDDGCGEYGISTGIAPASFERQAGGLD